MVDINKAIDQMSDEEINALIAEIAGGKGDKEKAEPEAPKAPAVDHDAIADRVADKLKPQPAAQPAQTRPTPEEFDQNRWAELMLKDARKAQAYLERTLYGVEIGPALPAMIGAIGALTQQVQELQTSQMMSSRPEFKANQSVVQQIMSERGWQPSARSIEDATDIAIARGLIKTQKEEVEQVAKPSAPPRTTSRGGRDDSSVLESALANAHNLTDKQLDDLATKLGIVSRGHLTGY